MSEKEALLLAKRIVYNQCSL